MKKLSLCVCAGALALSVFSQSGCVAVVAGSAGAGAVAYVRGEMESPLDANLVRARAATNRAIARLGFVKISEQGDATAVLFQARTVQDKSVGITLVPTTDRTTTVRIRVGTFGDEQLSLRILEEIKASL